MEKFQANAENYSINMMGSFYQRTTVLQNLCHAKQLLMTQGTESFTEYFGKVFALEKKDQKKIGFLKQIKGSQEYKKAKEYIDESLKIANHPKLRKLAELLTLFFKDPKHSAGSKVIVFT